MVEKPPIGIIGGSGLRGMGSIEAWDRKTIATPYGSPSSELLLGSLNGEKVVFLARHGSAHTTLPHKINYRANLWALREVGVRAVIAVATVGGIGNKCDPGAIVIPDQILDYTHSRDHTYSPLNGEVFHIDFTEPYCSDLRKVILDCADLIGVDVVGHGTYAATQGPRFESTAEIRKLERDGADVVGMTGMPETSLARELGLCYAAIALVVNHAAGKHGELISVEEIKAAYDSGFSRVERMISTTVAALGGFNCMVPARITP